MIHEARVSMNTSWVTPKWIFDWVGSFDLDPATFDGHPWPCAKENRTIDGLLTPWHGRVFLNPPYKSRQIEPFMERMADHRNGVAVVACRIETEWFQRYVFGAASAVFFPRGRIRFCNPSGEEMRAVAFPSCVVFYEPPPDTAPRPGTWWRPNDSIRRARPRTFRQYIATVPARRLDAFVILGFGFILLSESQEYEIRFYLLAFGVAQERMERLVLDCLVFQRFRAHGL